MCHDYFDISFITTSDGKRKHYRHETPKGAKMTLDDLGKIQMLMSRVFKCSIENMHCEKTKLKDHYAGYYDVVA